ncbi:MAG: hypothetical protein Q9186_005444 [Xanthomendoza sp. 1 TL-2023]
MIVLATLLSCLCFAILVVGPPPPPAPGTDPCGPFNHQGDAGFSTCESPVVGGGPAPYGVICGNDPAVADAIPWESCGASAKKMCNLLVSGALSPGEWHWTADHDHPLCRVGMYLSLDPSRGPLPNYRRCLNQILQPIIKYCITRRDGHNVGTVNILRPPDAISGDPGERVNPAYPAFIVSPMALFYSSFPVATANVYGDPNSATEGTMSDNPDWIASQKPDAPPMQYPIPVPQGPALVPPDGVEGDPALAS